MNSSVDWMENMAAQSTNEIEHLFDEMRFALLSSNPLNPILFLRNFLDSKLIQSEVKPASYSPRPVFSVDRPILPRSRSTNTLANLDSFEEPANETLSPFFSHIGVDIGGTLSKICIFESENMLEHVQLLAKHLISSETIGSTGIRDTSLSIPYCSGRLHFLNFQTRRINGALKWATDRSLGPQLRCVATGGGAYKYFDQMKSTNAEVVKGDELRCLLRGVNFCLEHCHDECFCLTKQQDGKTTEVLYNLTGDVFPYLLVNIGSGVSILRIDSETSFSRVSGTTVGGATFLGLCRLLTGSRTFEEALEMCTVGDNKAVDMLVGDIYGGDYSEFGLSASTVGASFGKPAVQEDPWENITRADIARAVLNLVGYTIAQIAYITSRRHNVTRIVFAGSFLRHNKITMETISHSIDYWSGGVVKALFLRHEGYFGALGALLKPNEDLEGQTPRRRGYLSQLEKTREKTVHSQRHRNGHKARTGKKRSGSGHHSFSPQHEKSKNFRARATTDPDMKHKLRMRISHEALVRPIVYNCSHRLHPRIPNQDVFQPTTPEFVAGDSIPVEKSNLSYSTSED